MRSWILLGSVVVTCAAGGATHLRAHLELTALLTPEQIARYNAMRGYAAEHRHGGP